MYVCVCVCVCVCSTLKVSLDPTQQGHSIEAQQPVRRTVPTATLDTPLPPLRPHQEPLPWEAVTVKLKMFNPMQEQVPRRVGMIGNKEEPVFSILLQWCCAADETEVLSCARFLLLLLALHNFTSQPSSAEQSNTHIRALQNKKYYCFGRDCYVWCIQNWYKSGQNVSVLQFLWSKWVMTRCCFMSACCEDMVCNFYSSMKRDF